MKALLSAGTLVFSLAVFCAGQDAQPAQTAQPAEIPSTIEESPLPQHEKIAGQLSDDLSAPLRLSSKQRRRLKAALDEEVDGPIDYYGMKYDDLAEAARITHADALDFQFQLFTMKNELPGLIRGILDAKQKDVFDKLVYDGYFSPYAAQAPAEPPAYTEEVKEVTVIGDNGKPVKKRLIIRRKKKAAPVQPVEVPAASTAAVSASTQTVPLPITEELPEGAYP